MGAGVGAARRARAWNGRSRPVKQINASFLCVCNSTNQTTFFQPRLLRAIIQSVLTVSRTLHKMVQLAAAACSVGHTHRKRRRETTSTGGHSQPGARNNIYSATSFTAHVRPFYLRPLHARFEFFCRLCTTADTGTAPLAAPFKCATRSNVSAAAS